MIIKQATLKGFAKNKDGIKLIFAVDNEYLQDDDMTRIEQLNADIGLLSFQRIAQNQTEDTTPKDESPSDRIKTALYEYWTLCYPGNKSFEMFYAEKMQGYIDQINNTINQINQNNE